MAIILKTPITMPVVNERTATKVWILNMNIDASHPDEPVSATFTLAPYCEETNEVFKPMVKSITVSNVFETCASNPALAQAIGAIYAAVETLVKENRLFGLEPDVPENTNNVPVITEPPSTPPEEPPVVGG